MTQGHDLSEPLNRVDAPAPAGAITQPRPFVNTAFCVLAVLAGWLAAHPYHGIRHDSVLYLGQVLLHFTAPILSQDVFFAAGSQDKYSIYSNLMVPLYANLGSLPTHILVLALSGAGLLSGVMALLKRLDPQPSLVFWGLVSFTLLSPLYGGGWVFGYGEPFVTARSFAEPLLVWSLVALLADRRITAASLQILAALFHPLMTLPVMAVSWCMLVASDRRWLGLLAAVPLVLGAALAGVAPWDGLLKTFDPYWWALFDLDNKHLQMRNWSRVDGGTIVLDLAVLLVAARLRPRDAGTRLLYSLVVVTTAMIALGAVFADGLQAVLMTQLQLWRAHWISHLCAMALAPWVVIRLWQLGGLWRAGASALSLAILNAHIGSTSDLATLLLWALISLAAWRLPSPSKATVAVVCACIGLSLLGMTAYQLLALLEDLRWHRPDAGWQGSALRVMTFPTVAFAALAVLRAAMDRSALGAAAALVVSAATLGLALQQWDRRPDLARAVESPTATPHPFVALIPETATVYWPDDLLPVWGLLGRVSHYTEQQAAGIVFNRHTALIYGPRKEAYRLIDTDRKHCQTGAKLAHDRVALARCTMPTLDRLTTLCSQSEAPDYLVLPDRFRAAQPLAQWALPASRDVPVTYSLYACEQFRTLPL
jgi:hypothetical protein